MSRAWGDVMSIARVEGLTPYDAAYLELADPVRRSFLRRAEVDFLALLAREGLLWRGFDETLRFADGLRATLARLSKMCHTSPAG